MDERICPETGKVMRRGVRPMTLTYKSQSITVQQPGWYTDDGENGMHVGSDLKVSDRALNLMKARERGFLEPKEIRRIRKKLALTQREAGRLIGGGVNDFQKYEAGDILISSGISNALRMLDRNPDNLNVLVEHNQEMVYA